VEQEGGLGADEAAALLRALHTLKGNSGMLGFAAVRDYVHEVEAVFRANPASWPQPLVDRLFEGAATLRRAIDQAGTENEAVAFARVADLPRPTASADTGGPAGTPEPRSTPDDGAIGATESTETAPTPGENESGESGSLGVSTELLRVPFEKVDALANQVAELLGLHSALDDLIGRHREELEAIDLRAALVELAERTERVANSLRYSATELRLVPVGRVFRRFPSLVRDLARAQGRRVRVVIEGEETALDKSTVDILGEPLLHLVRNAVDHGIRPPEERAAAGKPEEGTITLRATPVGDTVRIEVADDGTGLDRPRIVERARASGLLAPDEEVTADEAADLIFRPGFSTRHEADAVSGRGIGMDVVAASITRLRGTLEVEDEPGEGTRFVLRLPLTVAILPVVTFESAGQTLALPALEVEDIHRPAGVSWLAGAEVTPYGDEVVPLARLERLFDWSGSGIRGAAAEPEGVANGEGHPPRYVVIVRRGTRTAAVAADRLLDQRDVLVKALPSYLGQPPGVSGATIAPDGRVVLLLDAAGIIDLNLHAHRRSGRVAATAQDPHR
jgi:two-component system, chemotaxis family, sensor kinase CheA